MKKANLILGRKYLHRRRTVIAGIPRQAERRTDRTGVDGMLGEIIAFIAGTMAGVTLTCIVSVNQKDQREDDNQMEYLKEYEEKHKR